MLQQLASQSLNGFTFRDIPFLFLQLSASALIAWLIRIYWRKGELSSDEILFTRYLIPVQTVLTTIAIFSLKSPWMMMVFGFIALIPVLGATALSIRSKAFYLICVFAALGCGASNLVVTVLVTLVFILPTLHFFRQKN